MTKKIIFIFLMLAASAMLLFSAGKSGVQYLKEARAAKKAGNYYEAVLKLVDAILANPKNRQAQDMLLLTFPPALKEEEKQFSLIDRESSNYRESIDKLYRRFLQLQKGLEKLKGITYYGNDKPFDFDTTAYEQQFKKAFEIIARNLYREAEQLARSSDKDILQQAVEKFLEIENYYENYKDARQRYKETRKRALKRILLIIKDENGLEGQDNEFFEDAIFGQGLSLSPGGYNVVLRDLEGEDVEIDETFIITFYGLVYKPPYSENLEYTNRKSGQSAKVNEVTVKSYLACTFKLEIIDKESQEVLEHSLFRLYEKYEHMWASYEGDWDALTFRNKALVRQGKPSIPAMEELYRTIKLKSVDRINNFLDQYCE